MFREEDRVREDECVCVYAVAVSAESTKLCVEFFNVVCAANTHATQSKPHCSELKRVRDEGDAFRFLFFFCRVLTLIQGTGAFAFTGSSVPAESIVQQQ